MDPCSQCGKEISTYRLKRKALTCSDACSRKKRKLGYRAINPPTGLPAGTTGRISEMRVIIDLLKRGFDVYHAVSPVSPCDLAVLMNGKLLRIEVKTGHRAPGPGKIRMYRPPKFSELDILAIVMPEEIVYTPPL